MTAVASACSGGSKMEVEGKLGVELGSETDRIDVEPSDEKPGKSAGDSSQVSNGGSKDELLLQSDQDQKEDRAGDDGNNSGGGIKDSVMDETGLKELVNVGSATFEEAIGGDLETTNCKEEDRELSSGSVGVHDLAVDTNSNSDLSVIQCKKTEPSSDAKEDQTEPESKSYWEKSGDLQKENGESKVKRNLEVTEDLSEENGESVEFYNKESDRNGGLCEENGNRVLREEVKVMNRINFENGQDHSAANDDVDEKTEHACNEEQDSPVEPRESQETVAEVTKVNHEREPESDAELEGDPVDAITETDELGKSSSTIGDEEECRGSKDFDTGGDHQEGLKSSNEEEILNEVAVTTVMEKDQQPELDSAAPVLERQVSEIANQDHADQIEVEVADTAKEKLDDLSMSGDASSKEQLELALHAEEEQMAQNLVLNTSNQQDLEQIDSVELLQWPQTNVAESSGKAEMKSFTEGEGEQKTESIVTETLASESPLGHRKLCLETSAHGDECCEKIGIVREASNQTSLQTNYESASDENNGGSISDVDGKTKKAETSGENTVTADCLDDLHLNSLVSHGHKDNCGNSDMSHCFDKELVEENAIVLSVNEAAVYESYQSVAFDEASTLGTEGVVSTIADEPSEYDPTVDMVKESSLNPYIISGTEVEIGSNDSVRMSSGVNNDDVKEKACDDVGIGDSNLHIDHIITMQSESMAEKESLQFSECMVSSAHLDQSISTNECKEVEAVEEIQTGPDDQSASTMFGAKVDTSASKRQPCYIIRAPKFNNDELWTRIQCAQSEVDQKTKSRDLIKVSMQNQKATCSEYLEKLKAAREEENAARLALQSTRDKLGPIQAMMYKLKNAHSLEEIDDKIQNIEFKLQHETMPLKEEKKCINELKLLRQQREQLSYSIAPKVEIDEAYNQRDQLNERQKALMKELDSLRTNLFRAEANARAAEAKYDDEQKLLSDLRNQFHAANDIRQKAYALWRDLKNESIEKNKYFQMYKNDRRAAENYASSGDIQGLRAHCRKQVEKFMDLWNYDEQFRKQYVESNKNSTLRRLKTLDGRSLGPDEEPPEQPYDVKFSSFPLPSGKVSTTMPPHSEAKPESSEDDQFPALEATQEKKSAKPKKSTKPMSKEPKQTQTAVVLDREQAEFLEQEENVKASHPSKEEEELARKAEELARKEEELSKEKAAVELKEQRRLEQKLKAKEAEERKRRQAEKAQARAEYRAKKEAEVREKKRAKKKKLMDDVDAINCGDGGATTPAASNSPSEPAQLVDMPAATTSKRPSRTVVAAKQYSKVQPVPLPLRNRGKSKHRTWLWVLLATLVVLGLFLAGNYIFSIL